MTLHTLRLTLNPSTDNYQYDVTMIQSADEDQRKDALSIAPPGLPASDNLLLGVSGMESTISIDFIIYNDGTDKANGTYTSSVVTVEEQIEYLREVIHSPDFSAGWELTHLTGSLFDSDPVFVETVNPDLLSQQSPLWKPCRLTLRRGESI